MAWPFDGDAATWYAEVVTARDRLGLPIDGFDAQIAAICRRHDAALATRNLKDFEHTGGTPNGPVAELVAAKRTACNAAGPA